MNIRKKWHLRIKQKFNNINSKEKIIIIKEIIKGANPYLPVWEHIPDGEPRVFTYNGEKRVYVYGSHDTLRSQYCGKDYVVWSAPVDDLTNWRYDGVCYESMSGEPLYAPDVVEKDGFYYMYVAEDRGSKIYVAKSENPAGPFTDPVLTDIGFDPGVLVDDDGKIYVYWGFTKSHCAELEDDMATIKKDTVVENMIPHCVSQFNPDMEYTDTDFSFFEASSIRKAFGKYIFIYSKRFSASEPGYEKDTNAYLAYAYSDTPLGGWKYGGVISCNMGECIKGEDGEIHRAYAHCNNHGSIINTGNQWYIFYHRKTGTDEFARQGMIEPIDVAEGKDGTVYIGKVSYDESGEPVSASEVEMTSQGAHKDGLDAYGIILSAYACYVTPADNGERAYIQPVYEGDISPAVNIKSGTVIGFKYIRFGDTSPEKIQISADGISENTKIIVNVDSPDGAVIAELNGENTAELKNAVTGCHAVYFSFIAQDSEKDLCSFNSFTFM